VGERMSDWASAVVGGHGLRALCVLWEKGDLGG